MPPHPTPPHRNCPASLPFHCLERIGVERGQGGGQLRTAGSISGLTLDANANIGLGMEQTFWAIWPLAGRSHELIHAWISGQHGRHSQLKNGTTRVQLPKPLIRSSQGDVAQLPLSNQTPLCWVGQHYSSTLPIKGFSSWFPVLNFILGS